MRKIAHWQWMALIALVLINSVGCAHRPGWFFRSAPAQTASGPMPSPIPSAAVASGLPSRQAVHPASVTLPEAGRYDAATMDAIRTPTTSRPTFSRSNCFS